MLSGSWQAADLSAAQQKPETKLMDVASEKEVADYFRKQGKTVVTFCGYSGLGYENPEEMLREAGEILKQYDPKKTIVNCGATSVGIGQIYEIAKSRGFSTSGIVSSLAKESPGDISSHVDVVFFVKDETWGGVLKDTDRLSPTSQAMVSSSDVMIGIGGGEVARDELLAAKKLGKSVRFIPADMNHNNATERARNTTSLSPPTSAVRCTRRSGTKPMSRRSDARSPVCGHRQNGLTGSLATVSTNSRQTPRSSLVI